MKRLLLLILILAVPILGVFVAYRFLPYYTYKKVVSGVWSHEIYKLPRWDQRLLTPGPQLGAGELKNDFPGLWHEFHLRDVVVPLPTGHPMFRTIPIIQIMDPEREPEVGILFQGPTGREIARLYLLKSGSWNDQLEKQKLFQLPLVRRELKKKTPEQVWHDLFRQKIAGWDLPFPVMYYNLYLLHLRAAILPPGFIDYGPLAEEGMAYVEIASKNKDYRTEIVFSFSRGLLLSYLLVTERNNVDSDEIRTRFLKGISFRTTDRQISPIVYREFKQLTFNRQTDQEGMLYLFSAWSHQMEDVEMLKEMVYFMERGEKNGPQLKPLYRYIYERYKKTFTTRDVGLEDDDPEIRLQRQIELEASVERQKLQEKPKVVPKEEPITPRDRMDEYLRKAREERLQQGKRRRDKIIVH
jgi:hypothetical protein